MQAVWAIDGVMVKESGNVGGTPRLVVLDCASTRVGAHFRSRMQDEFSHVRLAFVPAGMASVC